MSFPPRLIYRLRIVLLGAFAMVPLITSASVQEHIYVRVPYLLGLATLVWLSAAVRSFRAGAMPARPPLIGLAMIWLGLSALSIYWAYSPQLVPVTLFRDFVIITSAGAYAVLAAPVRAHALVLLAVGALIALVLALIDHFTGPDPFAFRPFYQPSLAGGYAAMALAGSVAALMARRPITNASTALSSNEHERAQIDLWIKGLLTALAIASALTLWRTQAATATGSALAGVVAGVLITRGDWGRKLAPLVPLGALLVGGGLLIYFGAVERHPSAEIRLMLWSGAIDMLASNPLGGVGCGGFGASFPAFRPEGYWDTLFATSWSPYAHSFYLQTAAELGIAGLILPIAFVCAGLVGCNRLMRSAATVRDTAITAAITGALTAIAIVSVADLPSDYPLGRFLFFALPGLALARTAKEEEAAGTHFDYWIRRMLFVAVAVVYLIQCFFVEIDLVRSRIAYRDGEAWRNHAIAQSDRLTELEVARASGSQIESMRRARAGALDEALKDYTRAIDLPRFETQWTLRARLYAAAICTQVAVETPRDDPVRMELLRRSQLYCAQVEAAAPDFEDAEQLYAMIEFEMGDTEAFERQMKSYFDRRLGWDLRARVKGGQHGPETPAWEFVIENVPPEAPFFAWVEAQIAQQAQRQAELAGLDTRPSTRAQSRAEEALTRFRDRRQR